MPYVVVYGAPHAPLVRQVVPPLAVVRSRGALRPNATYYITKQIVPALARLLNLVGADVKGWFDEMPRPSARRLLPEHTEEVGAANSGPGAAAAGGGGGPPKARRTTLDAYYMSQHCVLCDALCRGGVCDGCAADPQKLVVLLSRRRVAEQQLAHLRDICMSCTQLYAPGAEITCDSLQCPVLFERSKVADTVRQVVMIIDMLW